MIIPLPVILNIFPKYITSPDITSVQDLYFTWAYFLPKDLSALRRDCLYLCSLNEAQKASKEKDFGYFLCTAPSRCGKSSADNTDDTGTSFCINASPCPCRDSGISSCCNDCGGGSCSGSSCDGSSCDSSMDALHGEAVLPPRTIMIPDINDLHYLTSRVQERFIIIRDWLAQINEGAMQNPSYQELLNYCEPILKNPLYVLDASYKLLACTKNLIDDDEIDTNLRELGYHCENSMHAFRKSNRFRTYQNNNGIIINPPGNPNKYATVSKWFWDKGMPVIHFIMVCSNIPPDDNLLALFELASENCALRFKQLQDKTPTTGHYYDSLLNDILFGELRNPRIIAERSRMAGLPMEGNFVCVKILTSENEGYPTARLLDNLLDRFPNISAICHGHEIIALSQKRDMKDDNELLSQIQEFLDKFDSVCGISEPFSGLTDLACAYTQACRAIGIGEVLRRYEPKWNEMISAPGATHDIHAGSIYFYDDVIVYYAVSQARNGNVDVFKMTPYLELVQKMMQNDIDHGTDNARLLYVYLVSERNASRTGKLLYMHRNNVLYRIPRITEKYGLDLDDYWIRMNLLLAFHLTELENAHKE